MATTYTRRITLFINGKEVRNDIASVRAELAKITNQQARMVIGSKEYNESTKNIKKLRGILAEHKADIDVASGGWQNIIKTAKELLPAFSFSAIAAGAVFAFTKIKDATDTLSTQWAIFMGGLTSATNEFWRTIATGDWTNFFSNMNEAIRVGRDYERMLDDIEAKQRALSIAEADSRAKQLELEDKLRNKRLPEEERIKAGQERIKLEEELSAKRTKLAQQTYQNELNVTKLQSKLGDDNLIKIVKDFDSETKIKAEAYLKQAEELRRVQAADAKKGAQTGVLFPGMQTATGGESERAKQLKSEIDNTASDVKEYAGLLSSVGRVTDAQLNKLVQTYSGVKEAENSAVENTRRVRTQVNSLLAKEEKEIKTSGAKTISAASKVTDDLNNLLEKDSIEQQKFFAEHFRAMGEDSWEEFINGFGMAQQTEGIKVGVDMMEPEADAPEDNYAIDKFQETEEFKLAYLNAIYDNGLISEQQYQDELTAITQKAEDERWAIKEENIQKAQAFANMAANMVFALQEMELEKAGENEEKKKQIRKKYANIGFLVTAGQIVADTAGAIMKGYKELGPIGGTIAAVLLGVTGMAQLGIANAQRKKAMAYSEGKYPLTTGMHGDKPHMALFNEVPGQPEMVVDGLTTRKLMINYPEIIRAIYQVRDGRPPQFADGKFPSTSLNSPPVGGVAEGRGGLSPEDARALTAALNRFADKKLIVYSEMIKKDIDDLNEIEKRRGL